VEAAVDGVPFTFIVNHFKSKSGGELETALRRRFQADHLAAVVEALTARGAHHVVALGDFNDYPYSQPLQILTRPQGSLVNVFMSLPRNVRYSYNFSGASQLLDTMLMTPGAADLVVSRVIFHINADFPASWSTDPRTPYRVSDHDIPFAIVRTAAFDPTPTSLPTPAASQSMPASPDLQDPPRPPWVSLAAVFLVAAAAVVLILIVHRRA
jgi:predicted extracellular nuclease